MAFNKIILRHSQYAPTTATTAVTGEILVQHAENAKDAALHILLNDGKTFEAIPSKTYVNDAVSSLEENVQDVRNIIRDNEEVVASSLNDIKERIEEVSSSMSDAISDANSAIEENSKSISTIETFLYSGDTNNVIDTVKDVLDYFSQKEEETSGLNSLINDVKTNADEIDLVEQRVQALEGKDNSGWDDAATNYLKNVKIKDSQNTLFEGVIDGERVSTIDLSSMTIDCGNY